ncbi:MAG TPA: hypothetical protein VF543_21060 [Pyrinomonadaceae bacterium]|jgi:hypothetical protein
MADRRKILIPVEPETPHFDAEETLLSARPVVPITPAESAPVFDHPQASTRAPLYRHSLFLPLLVIAAVGIGLAAGLAIARYRYLQRSASPVVAQPAQAPAVNDTRTATVQTPKSNEQAQVPALPEVKIEEKTTVDDTREDDAKTATPGASTKDEERSADRSSRDKDKEDNVKTSTPVTTRERKRADDEPDEVQDTPRAQRRERRARDRNEDVDDIPRRVERASEQINRIREIFEGRSQRP